LFFAAAVAAAAALHVAANLTAVAHDDFGAGPARGGATEGLDALDHIHAAAHIPKDTVFAVQPGGALGAQEELGAVGVGARVSHGENSRTGVRQLGPGFVRKSVAGKEGRKNRKS
jgi:hypothetical protein